MIPLVPGGSVIMMCAALLLTLLIHTCESQSENKGEVENVHVKRIHTNSSRPVMNTFFERIAPEQRFTAMSDEDDDALLNFWEQTWDSAGWEPVILNLQDAKQHPLYDSFERDLANLGMDEFSKLSILRWLAMAAIGGGWLVDYDAFPIRDFRQDGLINNGELTIYEAVAPTLVSGSADAWLATATFLLENAKYHCHADQGRQTFWTDSLGLLNAWRDPNCTLHVQKQVLDGKKALAALTADDCDKKPFRGKRIVHFGYMAMLEAPSLSPELRLPRHRLTMAKEWLPKWRATCYNTTRVRIQETKE